jgi:hypothetical protein
MDARGAEKLVENAGVHGFLRVLKKALGLTKDETPRLMIMRNRNIANGFS